MENSNLINNDLEINQNHKSNEFIIDNKTPINSTKNGIEEQMRTKKSHDAKETTEKPKKSEKSNETSNLQANPNEKASKKPSHIQRNIDYIKSLSQRNLTKKPDEHNSSSQKIKDPNSQKPKSQRTSKSPRQKSQRIVTTPRQKSQRIVTTPRQKS